MTRKQAKTLAETVEAEDAKCSAEVRPDNTVQITDHRSGHTAVFYSPEDWQRRKDAAQPDPRDGEAG